MAGPTLTSAQVGTQIHLDWMEAQLLTVSTTNARYFEDEEGAPVYLAGSTYWHLLQDGGTDDPPPAFDWDSFLTFAAGKGYNLIPFYVWSHTRHYSEDRSAYWNIEPLPYVNNGTNASPNFDLDTYDSTFFNRLRARAIAAGQQGCYVIVNLFHGFSVRMGTFNTVTDPWNGDPYKSGNNSNSIDGDPRATGAGYDAYTLGIAGITTKQKAMVAHAIDVLNDLDNVLWEICLESDGTYNYSGYTAAAWQEEISDYITSYEAGKAKQHPIIRTVQWPGGDNATVFTAGKSWDAGEPNSEPYLGDGTKVVISNTDHVTWTSVDPQWPWRALTRGNGGFILMDGGYSTYDDQAGGVTYAEAEGIRNNAGYAIALAALCDLLHTVPQNGGTDPCSTGYCLEPSSASYHEYLLFQPSSGDATLDLSAEAGTFAIRKINCADGTANTAQTVLGGASRTITQPTGWVSGWAAWVRPA